MHVFVGVQGGRDLHPTELPRGFRERFDKSAANMGRVTLSLSDSRWMEFHHFPYIFPSTVMKCSHGGGDGPGIPHFYFLVVF